MIDKVVSDAATAVADIDTGARVLIGGFGVIQGWPTSLLTALRQRGSSALTVILNSPWCGPDHAADVGRKPSDCTTSPPAWGTKTCAG